MREINKNMKIGKVQSNGFKHDKAEKAETSFCAESDEASIKDFSNPSAEVLGRSQVSKTDNLKEDVAFGKANPEKIAKADKLFNLALAKLEAEGNPHAYEIASSIATSEDAKILL